MVQLEQNYEIKVPPFVWFLKEKLEYDFDFSTENKYIRGSIYYGFKEKHRPKLHEVDINPELVEMQKILDQLAVKRFQVEINHD